MTHPAHPLRAKHADTDPVHAARPIRAGGHNTACLIWLDPEAPHQWLPDATAVTCSACERALARKAGR
ncbi:hypothetical protein GCM10010275_19330 [Streptomyces litmocidini]|uniref:hypothetical protein n=1 Tax=Streptomyces litmocidini TaxID=67318 RepID=UPI00167CAF06|nr:hypothetical protein [Streptomyces litmocidini]GGU84412.1 hypothetical protein GCM10010275_19330 [Streptomyces litmocidini]